MGAEEFTIYQVNSFRWLRGHDIKGRFSVAERRTVIEICTKFGKMEILGAACGLGFMSIIFSGMLWSNWSKLHSLRSTFFPALRS